MNKNAGDSFMNKKGIAPILIFGVPLIVLIKLFFMFFVIGPIADDALAQTLNRLGNNNICPNEFDTEEFKVCFNAEGDVIVDGKFDETITIKIDGTSETCHIKTGNYDFEYSGCRLYKFKQIEVHDILLISSKGEITLQGSKIVSQIMKGSGIITLTPKGIKSIKNIAYFLRFI